MKIFNLVYWKLRESFRNVAGRIFLNGAAHHDTDLKTRSINVAGRIFLNGATHHDTSNLGALSCELEVWLGVSLPWRCWRLGLGNLCCGGCPVHWRTFSNIPGPSTRQMPVAPPPNLWWSETSRGGGGGRESPPAESQWQAPSTSCCVLSFSCWGLCQVLF